MQGRWLRRAITAALAAGLLAPGACADRDPAGGNVAHDGDNEAAALADRADRLDAQAANLRDADEPGDAAAGDAAEAAAAEGANAT